MSLVPPGGLGASRSASLARALETLGAQVRRGGAICETRARSAQPDRPGARELLATGLPGLDQLLGGGLPRGQLCEVAGARSSGRTSFALSLLARLTQAGECAAVVDGPDSFDPASARSAGVDLERVLWVRLAGAVGGRGDPSRLARRCAERLLQTDGFPLVLLDWPHGAEPARRSAPSAPPASPASWLRLARLAAAGWRTLLLLAPMRLAGPHAAVSLELQPARAHFEGSPPLLDGLESRAVLVRHRSAPTGGVIPVRWSPGEHGRRPGEREGAA